ncbi:GNAT family N-acetyltransferase [Candidatus Marinamargulisbacteria bacterium SCGC AG-414-C22]|nr:GNAT family N-acetyltransferase [Candidatus Marinamargulisbacteria bacterium SCGC AG-414-C22]
MITYKSGPDIDIDQLIDLYKNTLTDTPRPTHSRVVMKSFLTHSNLIFAAYSDAKLVGICRGFTDFSYATYISDLAIHPDFQNQKIGSTLLKKAQTFSGKSCKIILLSTEKANSFYENLGFESHPRARVLNPT